MLRQRQFPNRAIAFQALWSGRSSRIVYGDFYAHFMASFLAAEGVADA